MHWQKVVGPNYPTLLEREGGREKGKTLKRSSILEREEGKKTLKRSYNTCERGGREREKYKEQINTSFSHGMNLLFFFCIFLKCLCNF